MNFIEVESRISNLHSQHYLLCIIGELTSTKDWRHAAAARTEMLKRLYGVSARGRKPNAHTIVDEMRLAAKHGENTKASAVGSARLSGASESASAPISYRAREERAKRRKKSLDRFSDRLAERL
jgi:hypothetical protein